MKKYVFLERKDLLSIIIPQFTLGFNEEKNVC